MKLWIKSKVCNIFSWLLTLFEDIIALELDILAGEKVGLTLDEMSGMECVFLQNTRSDLLTDSEEDLNEDTFEFLFRGRERACGMFNTF